MLNWATALHCKSVVLQWKALHYTAIVLYYTGGGMHFMSMVMHSHVLGMCATSGNLAAQQLWAGTSKLKMNSVTWGQGGP